LRRNFIEKERVDGFIVFKTDDYHDVLKKYDGKCGFKPRIWLATQVRTESEMGYLELFSVNVDGSLSLRNGFVGYPLIFGSTKNNRPMKRAHM